jgi:hypothetical protein
MPTRCPKKTKAALIEIAGAPLPARLVTAEAILDGFLLWESAAGVVMHLESPLPLDKTVALAVPGSLYGGGRIQWRHGKRHGVAFEENREELKIMLARWQVAPRPVEDLP